MGGGGYKNMKKNIVGSSAYIVSLLSGRIKMNENMRKKKFNKSTFKGIKDTKKNYMMKSTFFFSLSLSLSHSHSLASFSSSLPAIIDSKRFSIIIIR
jgi:hypothetical protein